MSNIKSLKEIAKSLLRVDPVPTGFGFVAHPFFEMNPCPCQMPNGKLKMFDLDDDGERQELIAHYDGVIERVTKPLHFMMILRKPYYLIFTNLAEESLSEEDFGEMLGFAWTMSENPNDDVNVSISEAVAMFKRANKRCLMDEEEYEKYTNLPQKMTAYRGIANGHNPKGLSYTLDLEKAKWFANRWNSNGYILKAEVDKENVLCYFASRGEEEIVVDSSNINPERL